MLARASPHLARFRASASGISLITADTHEHAEAPGGEQDIWEPKTPLSLVQRQDLTPDEIIRELDKHVVGHAEAKKALAIAVHNRSRRAKLSPEDRKQVRPWHILLSGQTGTGKSELVKRLAAIIDAPFTKAVATEYTEVGYVGRDVSEMCGDLVKAAKRSKSRFASAVSLEPQMLQCVVAGLRLCQDKDQYAEHAQQQRKLVQQQQARGGAVIGREVRGLPEGLLALVKRLQGAPPSGLPNGTARSEPSSSEQPSARPRASQRCTALGLSYSIPASMADSNLDTIDTGETKYLRPPLPSNCCWVHRHLLHRSLAEQPVLPPGFHTALSVALKAGQLDKQVAFLKAGALNPSLPKRPDAMLFLTGNNSTPDSDNWPNCQEDQVKVRVCNLEPLVQKVLEQGASKHMSKKDAELRGIIFIDEIDKLLSTETSSRGFDTRVQQDLLPLLEGNDVSVGHGQILGQQLTFNTEQVLFICAGAFSKSSPDDLLPELLGRLPIRCSLAPPTEEDFFKFLTVPKYSAVEQHKKLMATDGVELIFEEGALRELAHAAYMLNGPQNLGARRLFSLLDLTMQDYSLRTDMSGKLVITKEMVEAKVASLLKGLNTPTDHYIL
jgi:ATP-dependent protease HslVU (ClpYQ) ATPase subunit